MGMIIGVALIAGWARAMARRAAKRSNKASATASSRFDLCNDEKFSSSYPRIQLTVLDFNLSLIHLPAFIWLVNPDCLLKAWVHIFDS